MYAALIEDVHSLRPHGISPQEVVLACEERQPEEGQVHEALDSLVELGVGRVLVVGGEGIFRQHVPQQVEAVPLLVTVVGEFSHSVERVHVDVLVDGGVAHGVVLDCVSAIEGHFFSIGVGQFSLHLIAVVVSPVVGDVAVVEVRYVDAGQQGIRVACVHGLWLLHCFGQGGVGLVEGHEGNDGGVTAQHRVHLLKLLQEVVLVAKQQFLHASGLYEPSKADFHSHPLNKSHQQTAVLPVESLGEVSCILHDQQVLNLRHAEQLIEGKQVSKLEVVCEDLGVDIRIAQPG